MYTVECGEYPYMDDSLSKHIPEGIEVIRRPIREPYEYYRIISGKKEKVNPTVFANKKQGGWKDKLTVWIRGNLFIPDPRCLWIKPSVKYLSAYLKSNPVDFIVSTGPPHSLHLIARKLRRRFNIPWLADFRDPWTKIYYFHQMSMSWFAKALHQKLECRVLQQADLVTTVSKHCKLGFESIYPRPIAVIPNGYEEFKMQQEEVGDDKIRMLCSGVLSRDRNPSVFWKVLEHYLSASAELMKRFELWMIGDVDQMIIQEIRSSGLNSVLHVSTSIPHDELQKHLARADILLLIGVPRHPEVITGKFFEYLYLRKPIFSIAPPDSDIVEILIETGAGLNADFYDQEGLKYNLETIFEIHFNQSFHSSYEKVSQYSRKNLTGQLAQLLGEGEKGRRD